MRVEFLDHIGELGHRAVFGCGDEIEAWVVALGADLGGVAGTAPAGGDGIVCGCDGLW